MTSPSLQVVARTESQGPGGKVASQSLLRAIQNRFGVSEVMANEAIIWVQG